LTFDRARARDAFLADAGLAEAPRTPVTGDASTRSYSRLVTPGGVSLILMDQPPALETRPCPPEASEAERKRLGYNAQARLAAGRIDAFVACAAYLRGLGLSAPKVTASDFDAGFALLEDLGDDLYARLMEGGADEAPLYEAAVDALLAMHATPPPDILIGGGANWPLLTYDALALKTGTDLFIAWLPALWPDLASASVFCHRDYHAENLIWLPDRAGAARVGLLDFQDALLAHPAWDLSMLLHDARRDVQPEREMAVLGRYFEARPSLDRDQFMADFHAAGAMNMVRILGLFARLVVRDAKPRYRAFMPRLWRYLARCLEAPAPAGLAAWLDRHVPAWRAG
jgi:aminoglycoside/choline kinase family phosphotransferase